jgi:hypothetical protein
LKTKSSIPAKCWRVTKTGEDAMREFIVACLVAGVIAVGAAAILENFVQEPASVAFAEPGVRV